MDLPAPLAWLVDKAGALPGPDSFLAELGVRLLAEGLPLAGGALTLAVPHPIIARRTWLWRAETGAVIEALGFAGGLFSQAGHHWLAELGPVQEDTVGPESDSPSSAGRGGEPAVPCSRGRPAPPGRALCRGAFSRPGRAGGADSAARGLSGPAQGLPFGAALHLGAILWGNIGAADRLDFTAIGPAVNLVSRQEGLWRPLGRSVLISGALAAETTTPPVPLGEHGLRGTRHPGPSSRCRTRKRPVAGSISSMLGSRLRTQAAESPCSCHSHCGLDGELREAQVIVDPTKYYARLAYSHLARTSIGRSRCPGG